MQNKETILPVFAERLKTLREEKGYSLRALASSANLEYSQVQRIEKGKVNLSLTTLFALADGLDISPSQLLNY